MKGDYWKSQKFDYQGVSSGGAYMPPPAHRLIKNTPVQIGLIKHQTKEDSWYKNNSKYIESIGLIL